MRNILKRKEFMADLFHKFICLLILNLIFISCASLSPTNERIVNHTYSKIGSISRSSLADFILNDIKSISSNYKFIEDDVWENKMEDWLRSEAIDELEDHFHLSRGDVENVYRFAFVTDKGNKYIVYIRISELIYNTSTLEASSYSYSYFCFQVF